MTARNAKGSWFRGELLRPAGQIKCYDIFDGARLQSIETTFGSEFGHVPTMVTAWPVDGLLAIAAGFVRNGKWHRHQRWLTANLIYGDGMQTVSGVKGQL